MIDSCIKKWIDSAEPDYFILFVSAWIPFNAWYMTNFCNEDERRTSDRDIIDYIKQCKMGECPYKEKIITLLKGHSPVSHEFRNNLAQLHYALRHRPIPNIDEGVSFAHVRVLDNNNPHIPFAIGDYTYKGEQNLTLPKTSPRYIFEVIRTDTMKTEHMVRLRKCSISELVTNEEFLSLPTDTIKEGVKKLVNELSPNKMDSLVVKETHDNDIGDVPPESFVLGEERKLYLVNNTDLIARAVIQLMYDLRCMLFHGEVIPCSDNSEIYRYAYKIQKILINNLI